MTLREYCNKTSEENDASKFYISIGTVQPYVVRRKPWFMRHWGLAEYERDKPVLSEGRFRRALPIVEKMNSGELSPEEGMAALEKDAWI